MSVYFNGKKVSMASTTKIYGGKYNVTAEDKEDGTQKLIINTTPTNPAIVPTGTIDITENEQVDVTRYAFANVNVESGITPTGTLDITSNGVYDVTNYASANVNVSGVGGELPAFMSAKNFTFNGNACTGYVGDNNLPEIIIPRSYSTVSTVETVVGAKVLDKFEIRYIIRDFLSATFSDGENNTHTYSSPMELDMLENDFPNDCYLVSMEVSDVFNFDFLNQAYDMQILQFPININGQRFSDGMTAFDYIMQDNITNVNFAGDVEIISYVDGNDYQVTAITKAGNGFDNYNGKIILLNNITLIGDDVFSEANLNSLVVPYSVNSVGSYFIYNCPNLTDILLMANITSIPQEAFSFCPLLKNINIPDTVTEIGSSSFIMCSSFTSISIPEGVTCIGALAFAGCSLLQSINVSPNNQFYMTESGVLFDKAQTTLLLYPAGKLDKTYIVPNGVTSISAAFVFCTNIQLVELPSTVTSIEDNAFTSCANLTTVTIKATIPPTIQSTTFDDTVQRYEVPAESVEAYKTATNWANYADKIFAIPTV